MLNLIRFHCLLCQTCLTKHMLWWSSNPRKKTVKLKWSRVEFCMRKKHGTRSLGIEDVRIHWDWKPGKCICGTEENSAELEWDSKNSSNISFCFSISIYKMSCKNGIRRIMKIELLIILQYRAAVLTSIIREIIALLSE